MRLILVSLLAVQSWAATSIKNVNFNSPTNAIVTVYTDQAGNCTYRATAGTIIGTLVNDVNTALFASSNSDARAGSIVRGGLHTFILGTNSAPAALDGKHYSRALQAATNHIVGVTCGGDAEVTQVFTTANIKLGTQGPLSMPFDSTSFGNVQTPTINWTDRSAGYIDPITGASMKRATDPLDVGFSTGTQPFLYAVDSSGHWGSPNNALSASSGSLATCNAGGSCGTSDALFLSVPISGAITNFASNGGWQKQNSWTDFLALLWGSGTDASSSNRTVAVCWTTDGQTCATSSINIAMPLTTADFAGTTPKSWSARSPWNGGTQTNLVSIVVASTVATLTTQAAHGLSTSQTICINGIRNQITAGVGGNGLNGCHVITGTPTTTTLTFDSNAAAATYSGSELMASVSYPTAQFGSWGTAPIHSMVGQATGGTVTCVAGACTLTASNGASYFNQDLAANTPIFITGSSATCAANSLCTIASVTDYAHLTLNQALTISGATWSSANFGILIKKTTGTGSVSVSAAWEAAMSAVYDSGLDGSGDICNSNSVTVGVDASGNSLSSSVSGYLCVLSASNIANKATTPIYLLIPSTGETRLIARNYMDAAADYREWIGWHPTDGASWYTCQKTNCTGIFKTTYTGDYRAYTPGFNTSLTEAPVVEKLTYTDAFSGSTVATQISNCFVNLKCDTQINTTVFGTTPSPPSTGAAIQGKYLVLASGSTGCNVRDCPGYVTYWDMSVTPGNLLWAGYTFDKFPVGYGAIHSVIQFGTGQFNAIGLNGQLDPAGGVFGGPWQTTPVQLDKGSGFISNTSVSPGDGVSCPAGLSSQWQALGAKPIGAGGLALCLTFKIPGQPCSIHASTIESTAFPCPWSGASDHSLIKSIGEGDTIHDQAYGFVSFGEFMLVVKVTQNSLTDIDVVVFRYRSAPLANFVCGSGNGSEMTHANGWTWDMAPYLACAGGNYWTNALDSTRTWTAEAQSIFGSHADFGQGQTNYTYVEGATQNGYQFRANQAMPGQIGQDPSTIVLANPANGSGKIPDIYLQSYPSKRQQAAVALPSEMNWSVDVRSYNPSSGADSETPEALFGNTVTLVGGTTQTYLITFPGTQTPDPKHVGFVGWSGYHMLRDLSGPGSVIGDSDSWGFCEAYVVNECRTGSVAGSTYVSIPNNAAAVQCVVNSYKINTPCLSNLYPLGWFTSQVNTPVTDPTGVGLRRLTGGLVAPGRGYNFINSKPTPDGKWIAVQSDWLDGQASEMMWVQVPSWPAISTQAGLDSFSNGFSVYVNGVSGDTVRVTFGYDASFRCTSRNEACWTSAAATVIEPFLYDLEAASYKTCSSGCSINVPAQSGRVLYYAVQRKNGATVTTGDTQVTIIP